MQDGLTALQRLFTDRGTAGLRVQPCLSPVWDTCLAAAALSQAGEPADGPALRRTAAWLLTRQSHRRGDWAGRNPAAPGGWAFEFRNDFYPDVDDTAMALIALSGTRLADVGALQSRAAARPRRGCWVACRTRMTAAGPKLRSRERQALASPTSHSPITTR